MGRDSRLNGERLPHVGSKGRVTAHPHFTSKHTEKPALYLTPAHSLCLLVQTIVTQVFSEGCNNRRVENLTGCVFTQIGQAGVMSLLTGLRNIT